MTDKLREAAQAIVDRWDSPAWGGSAENLRHTGEYIAELRAALAQHSVYQLPDDLYPDSKCWVDGTYAERVEWLHTMYESSKQTLNVLLGQQDAQAVPPGYKLVPVKVTEEMEKAWWTNFGDVHALWAAMLNAAPTPPAQRVMLTDEEIEDLARGKSGHSDFARDIIEAYERKNGIK